MPKIMPSVCIPRGCEHLIKKGENPLISYKYKTLTSGGLVKDIFTQPGNIVAHNITVKFPEEKAPAGRFVQFINKIKRKLNGPSYEEIDKAYQQANQSFINRLKAEREGDTVSLKHYTETTCIANAERSNLRQQHDQAPIPRIKRLIEKSRLWIFDRI